MPLSPELHPRAPGCACSLLPVEGKLVHGFDNMDVGQRLRVQLTSVDVDRGFIDFKKEFKEAKW